MIRRCFLNIKWWVCEESNLLSQRHELYRLAEFPHSRTPIQSAERSETRGTLLVDQRRIELRPSACRADVLPLSLPARILVEDTGIEPVTG